MCSYCKKELGEVEPLDDTRVSHGMCQECVEHFSRQWLGGQRLGEYLDKYDKGVIVVEPGGRVVAANTPMARMLNKTDREVFGLLGGEAMECQYARLPGGCGETVHCQTCTIRNRVQQTLATGESQIRVPAHLTREDTTLHFLISTRLQGEFVEVVIEEVINPI